MEIKKVWSVWFSATGTTKKVASLLSEKLAEALGAETEEVSFNLPAAREKDLFFGQGDLVVLAVPTYAGRVPNLLLPYIREKIHGDGALGVPVVLYGNRNFDDSLIELRNVMEENGFHTVSAGAFVGEHSFSTVLGAGRPDGEDLSLAEELAARTAEKVKTLTEAPGLPVEVEGCDPVRPYYTPRDRRGEPIRDFLKAKPVTDPAKCVSCGMCARICPMGAIDPRDVFSVPGKCIKCCACVKRCLRGAKYFDHEGYLYHRRELEEQYAGRRAESRIFL